MKIIRSPEKMQKEITVLKRKGKSVGLVPTMGALHEGHLSLVSKAVKENDIAVVSIFVNPVQFGPNEDYLRYPRPFNKDSGLCRKAGVDIIFAPEPDKMYDKDYRTYINVEGISDMLCGKFRPGHFRGVATVVAKLFNVCLPDKAYFGMKDYQQLKVIEKMASDLNFPVKIMPCPIVRESSGLAMSSRNSYLDPAQKQQSALIRQALQQTSEMVKYNKSKNSGKIIENIEKKLHNISGSKIDYIAVCSARTLMPLKEINEPAVVLVAVWVGKTRLIDNILIH
jgi:pantoate--beta-alanine ligase